MKGEWEFTALCIMVDLMRHPNIKLTADGGAAPYIHSPRCLYAEEDLDFIFTSLDDIEIIDEMEES